MWMMFTFVLSHWSECGYLLALTECSLYPWHLIQGFHEGKGALETQGWGGGGGSSGPTLAQA